MNEKWRLSFQGKIIKNYNALCEDIAKFRVNFKSKADKIELFIEESECFLVAFFGLLSLKKEPILVQNARFSEEFLDKNKFDQIMQKKSEKNAKFSLNEIDKNAIFYIKTSGSSGTPKLVLKTFCQMCEESKMLSQNFKINENDIIISCVSNQHLYGLSFQIFLPLISGARLEKMDFEFFNLLNNFKEKNFIFISSPILLKSLANSDDLAILKDAKIIFSAGGKIDNQTKINLKPFNLIEIYGGSEMGVVAFNKGQGFVKFSGVNLSVNSENRLLISSIWQQNFAQNKPYLSSDIVRLDGDKIELLGRFDRIVKVHEKRISLDLAEQRLKECEFIEDARVFLGENQTRLSALLVLNKSGKECFKKHGKKGVVEALKKHIYADFGARIRYFKICENLPFDKQGKISQNACVKAFSEKIEPEFKVLEKSQNEVRLKSYISEACFYFEGHFANFPLIPGFCELKFALQNARKYLKIKNLIELENIKFTGFLRPFEECFLNLSLKNEKLYFELFANDLKCCSGRAKVSFEGEK